MRHFARSCRRLLLWLLVLLSLLLWCNTRSKSHSNRELRLRIPSDTLAHFLADFSNEQKLDDRIIQWSVVEESREVNLWRYRVEYATVGESCEVVVEATVHAPYSVHKERRCYGSPSSFWWWEKCHEEVSQEAATKGMSRYRETCAFGCSVWARLSGHCGAIMMRRDERKARFVAQLRSPRGANSLE